jgi:hypothetical protein
MRSEVEKVMDVNTGSRRHLEFVNTATVLRSVILQGSNKIWLRRGIERNEYAKVE